jgi:hypothetical protein
MLLPLFLPRPNSITPSRALAAKLIKPAKHPGAGRGHTKTDSNAIGFIGRGADYLTARGASTKAKEARPWKAAPLLIVISK